MTIILSRFRERFGAVRSSVGTYSSRAILNLSTIVVFTYTSDVVYIHTIHTLPHNIYIYVYIYTYSIKKLQRYMKRKGRIILFHPPADS